MALAAWMFVAGAMFGACDQSSGSAGGNEVEADALTEDHPSLEQVCGLIKPSEVEAVLGRKVGKPREPAPLRIAVGMRACAYGDPAHGEVTVGLTSAFAPQVFKKAVAKQEGDGGAIAPIQNLGDEAVAFFGGWLLVREGRYVVYLGITRSGRGFSPTEAAPTAVREENIALAFKALERLPRPRT